MSEPTILVTGAAGFIASHASQALLNNGWRVVGVDNFCDFYARERKESNASAVRATAQELGDSSRFVLHEADITDGRAMNDLIGHSKPQAILHLAAMAGVRPSIERPAHYARVNIEGTAHLLQAAVDHGVEKFLFASSSSVYGNQKKVPFSETDSVEEPISPYAATKRAGELLAYTYWHLYRLPIFCLRFFTVFGPRQRPDLAIHKFTKLIAEGKPVPMFGDGSTSRDYTFIADICTGILAALERCDRYRIYNLGGNDPVTLARLISEIETALGKKAIIDCKPMQPGDVERTYADLTRSGEELGYKPQTSLSEGLRRFVEWFRNQSS